MANAWKIRSELTVRLIAEKLKSEARRGRTILVITHDKELIESCCDNVVEVSTKLGEVL